MKVPLRDSPLLAVFLIAVVVAPTGSYWLTANIGCLPGWLRPVLEGFGGNITAGVVGSFLFLLLTVHLDKRTTRQIDRIHQAASKSEEILSRRQRILRNQEHMQQFDDFLRRHSYYDVRFPDLKSAPELLGLQYTIEPIRDPKTNQPLKHETEMEVKYVIRVQGPDHWQFMKKVEQEAYEGSPIREGEYYFCQFFNDSWHMAPDSVGAEAHCFYLSGKVGPSERGTSANAFVARTVDPPVNSMVKVAHLFLRTEDGTVLEGEGGCDQYDIYKDKSGTPFLSINDSPPKKIYFTNPPNTYGEADWVFVIADIRGRASGQKLENIKRVIGGKLAELQLEAPKIPWYEMDEYREDRA
jgi:hypothetical protein